ncbi:MAG: hypothetical protein PHR35_16845, partial [Kiritimatiellae bacterium]|nr:hypothetical protein [Kiritimatiellia bacterium]
MNKRLRMRMSGVLFGGLLVILGVTAASAATWIGTGTGDWNVPSNWDPASVPTTGDTVVIANDNASVLLTNAVGYFDSLLLSNKVTLVFSNWVTSLSAGNITIATNAAMQCSGPYTNNAMSNRVYLVCTNLAIHPGGRIDVNELGYAGGGPNTVEGQYAAGNGPGHWTRSSVYGGMSKAALLPVGSATNAEFAGSGATAGYHVSSRGGHGGGAVRIEAIDRVDISGSITANGGAPVGTQTHASSGTGGGIYIACRVISGTNGRVEAKGGTGATGVGVGQVGTGGRIAVHYSPAAQSDEPLPQIAFNCSRGVTSPGNDRIAEAGTVYFTDDRFVVDAINNKRLAGQIVLGGGDSLSTDNLTVDNVWVGFQRNDFRLTVSNNLLVKGPEGRFEIGGATYAWRGGYPWGSWSAKRFSGSSCPILSVGGNLVLTNGASLCVYSGMNAATSTSYGALIAVGDTLAVHTGSYVNIDACPTNSSRPFFQLGSLLVATNARISA